MGADARAGQLRLTGRVLHLVDDPELLRAQLDGVSLDAQALAPGRASYLFGVNTDAMISGRACTLGYSDAILGPHFLADLLGVVGVGDIARGGFQVVVGGAAYGSGSSREAAVVAHRGAGIELVIAQSFQRIFQENLVYTGLPFTTDTGVLHRLEAGEGVDLAALTADLPPLFRAIARAGGLLPYGRALLAGGGERPWKAETRPVRPLNLVERLIARNTWVGEGAGEAPEDGVIGVASVRPGEQVLLRAGFRGTHEYTTGMVAALYAEAFGDAPITRPTETAAFEDHFVLLADPRVPHGARQARLAPAQALAAEQAEAAARLGLPLHGPGRALPAGVCHHVVVDRYARVGEVVVLTDSHTPTAGVLGTLAFGVGSTAMAFALRTGLVPVTVPRVLRVEVHGAPAHGLTPKDLALHLIGHPLLREEQWREHPADTAALELSGPGLDGWTLEELAVLTNMTVEGGLMTGVVDPRVPAVAEALAARGQRVPDDLVVDPGATYAATLRIDLADVPLTVATPGDSRNRARLADHAHVPVHNVVIASCTGGSLADLRAAAAVLHGRHKAHGVRLTVTPASAAVAEAAARDGTLAALREAGAEITESGCGACIGNGPGIPRPGETTVSTTNRNYDRRMGAPGPVWLASPAVAAASAVTGRLTDPRDLPTAERP